MLLKKEASPKIDYMENWPVRYYEIEDAYVKKACLEQAIREGLDPIYDPYRMKLLVKRFFTNSHDKKKKKAASDRFMHSWMMIKAATAMDHQSFLRKKAAQKELLSYMKDLCLIDYEPETSAEKQILTQEWKDFAAHLIEQCVGSHTYCSALFGIVPIGDARVAGKIVSDINLITKEYPAKFGYAEYFTEFRQILIEVYCQKIENGASYWEM